MSYDVEKKAVLYIVLAGVAWGTAGIFVNYLTGQGFLTTQLAFSRCLVSAVTAFGILAWKNTKALKLNRKQAVYCAVGGSAFCTMAMFYYAAMKAASVSTASVMLNMAPLLVLAVSVVFLKEKLNVYKILAIVMAFIGCALLVGIVGGLSITMEGLKYGGLATISYAAYSVCTKLAINEGTEPETATAYCFFFGSIIGMFFVNPVTFIRQVTVSGGKEVFFLILMGFVTGYFASFMYARAMKGLPVAVVSSMASIEPLTSTVLSIVILKEVLSIWQTVGIFMILIAVGALGKMQGTEKQEAVRTEGEVYCVKNK